MSATSRLPADVQKRRAAAIQMLRKGADIETIAAHLGVTTGRIYAYVRDADIPLDALPHSRRGTAWRHALVVQMAGEAYREEAIAERVGITVESVRELLRKKGVPTLSERLGTRPPRINSNRAMDGIVSGALPSSEAIAAIDWSALDCARLADWHARLSEAIRELSALDTRLRREVTRCLQDTSQSLK